MIHILRLSGTDPELYPLVGPLVMNPSVLKYNNRYPFKTGEKYVWHIATDDQEKAIGFIPVELKKGEIIINNYYAQQEGHDEILSCLLHAVCDYYIDKAPALDAVVQTAHKDLFSQEGFQTIKEWKLYLKMERKNERND